MKIATVFGARTQFVKAAAVSRALHQFLGTMEIIIHMDHHYDRRMSDIVFRELEMKGTGTSPWGRFSQPRRADRAHAGTHRAVPDCKKTGLRAGLRRHQFHSGGVPESW